MCINLYELKVTVILNTDLHYLESYSKLSDFINFLMLYDENLRNVHTEKRFKYYCFSSLFPFSNDKIYKSNKNYEFIIRSIDREFISSMMNSITIKDKFKEFRILRFTYNHRKASKVNQIISITPAIMTTETGYWKIDDSIELLQKRVYENLIKKYKNFYNIKMQENVLLINSIEILNQKPIKIPYKNIHMLGNKFRITFNDNEGGRLLAKIALGAGILEKNSLGMGFCFANYN